MIKKMCFMMIFLSVLFSSCFFKEEVSGTSMETENSIAFQVSLANGSLAKHTDVFIRPADYVAKSNVLESSNLKQGIWNGKTDENGKILVKNLKAGKYTAEARGDSLKGLLKFEFGETAPDTFNIQMKKPGAISGTVEFPSGYNSATIGVLGLEYFTEVDSTGFFSFDVLPADSLVVLTFMESDSNIFSQIVSTSTVVIAEDTVYIDISINTKMDTTTYTDTLFYESFEDSTKSWYVSKTEYATANLKIQNEDNREGLVAYFTYTNDSINGWALMGHALDSILDLSFLDSISFYARGDGRISFAFDHLSEIDSTLNGKAWIHIEIDSKWTRYVVKPSDFLEADDIGGNTGWDAVKKEVSNITFFGNHGTHFWLDDVVLYSTRLDIKEIE
jgi:hypothetical protein